MTAILSVIFVLLPSTQMDWLKFQVNYGMDFEHSG